MARSTRKPIPKCPICDKAAVFEFRPFCSRRCGDIDLSHWLGGSYRVPAAEQDDNDAEPEDED